jgi:hypothetical protein
MYKYINRIQLIKITKDLLTTFLKKLSKCDDDDNRVEYYYLLDWVNNLHKKDKNIQKSIILNLFNENIEKLVNDYMVKKNDYININSAIGSAVFYKFFNNYFEAIECFVFNKKHTTINFLEWKNKFAYRQCSKNASEAYPPENRPRKYKDIKSVEYHQSLIRENKNIQPIWTINKSNDNDYNYTILDGFHRLVAYQIEKKYDIPAYIVYV